MSPALESQELKPPLIELPAGQTFFRVQLLRARSGTVKFNGLLLALDCFKTGHQGLIYASAQHLQHACVCLFPGGIAALKRQQQWPLVKPGTRQLLHAVVDAARRSGVPLLGDDTG